MKPLSVETLRSITLNNMTPAIWNKMTPQQRREWHHYWGKRGLVSFCCLKCGFPTTSGQSGCEACEPE